jgi:poly(A) polymerase
LLDVVVERADQPFVHTALADTDRRVGEGKPVAPSFLLACVLWADVRDGWAVRLSQGDPSFPALQDAVEDVFNARIGDVSGRGKLGADMREIWMMQPRFDKRSGSTPFSLVEQARFRASFDFLRLRAHGGEVPAELGHWWEAFSLADNPERERLMRVERDTQSAKQAQAKGQGQAPRTVRRVKAEPVSDSAATPSALPLNDDASVEHIGENTAPKKRRRRRKINSSNDVGNVGDTTESRPNAASDV